MPAGRARRPAGALVHDRRVLRSHLPDLTPLRVNPAYRRLYAGFTLSNVGSQMAVVAIGLQVYAITGSTASVGLVGFFALVPLVAFGLYGGSLSDHHDRRLVALVANLVAWATSIAWRAAGLARQRERLGALPAGGGVERRVRGELAGPAEHLPADPAARAAARRQRPRRSSRCRPR